ncbi:MAG: thioredoxin domain-containing protein, partial [Planctomycetes bacterium]|nr:thioredoxin domain-containing protein [Planctomycetota bacterium]
MLPRAIFVVGCLIALLVASPGRHAEANEKKAKPKFTNRLAKETSPYLLMHAHNPTNWYAWGPEAFAKAKKEGKLIFLSIGYSSCFWCHVMERESFNNEAVAKILNESFVCIKVDREERPDIDHIYMTALQAHRQSGG